MVVHGAHARIAADFPVHRQPHRQRRDGQLGQQTPQPRFAFGQPSGREADPEPLDQALPEHRVIVAAHLERVARQRHTVRLQAADDLFVLVETAAPRLRGLPWAAIGCARLVNPMLREIWPMRYLWCLPHRLDGAGLQRIVGDIPATPLAEAMRATLAAMLGLADQA